MTDQDFPKKSPEIVLGQVRSTGVVGTSLVTWNGSVPADTTLTIEDNRQFTDEEIESALAKVCDKGPYMLDFEKSVLQMQVYRCQACGAEIRFNATISH